MFVTLGYVNLVLVLPITQGLTITPLIFRTTNIPNFITRQHMGLDRMRDMVYQKTKPKTSAWSFASQAKNYIGKNHDDPITNSSSCRQSCALRVYPWNSKN